MTATSDSDVVTVEVSGTYTGTLTGEGTVDDVLSLASGSSIAGGTVTNIEALTIASGGTVTMKDSQYDNFTGTITADATET